MTIGYGWRKCYQSLQLFLSQDCIASVDVDVFLKHLPIQSVQATHDDEYIVVTWDDVLDVIWKAWGGFYINKCLEKMTRLMVFQEILSG